MPPDTREAGPVGPAPKTPPPAKVQDPAATVTQLSFDDAPARDTAAILTVMDADAIHARDREVIVDALVAEADDNGGLVDPNKLRARLRTADRIPYPKLVGATIGALARAGVLEFADWTVSDDAQGGNAGKPARR